MREIKFRFWSQRTKTMSPPIDLAGMGRVYSKHENATEIAAAHIPLQFTGLHDKNGKEIFEADIVGYWGGKKNGVGWQVGWDKKMARWSAVYFETEKIPATGQSLADEPAFSLTQKLCDKKEIIGNIYENSDLLV